MSLAIARVLHGTRAEGPFLRSAVWVQGCSIRCPGCINPHLFDGAGRLVDPVALAEEINLGDAEGVTLLGGEPFDQADPCAELAEHVKRSGRGVITFTGHQHRQLRSGPRAWRRLLDATDLLVDGPFELREPETERSLVGSTNQRFVHLTDRYESFDPAAHPNRLELRISATGEAQVAGFLTRSQLNALR